MTQRDERVLVVWSDELDAIIPLCRSFENSLIRQTASGVSTGPSLLATTSVVNPALDTELNEEAPKQASIETPPDLNAKSLSSGSWWGWKIGSRAKQAFSPEDVEKGRARFRPVRYFGPFYSGLALALSTCAVSSFIYGITILDAD